MPTAIPFKITVYGIDELPDHRGIGVTHVISILDPEWPVPGAFGSYREHERRELWFHDVIEDTPDMVAAKEEHVAQVLAFGQELITGPFPGAHLLVHCPPASPDPRPR